MIVATPTTADGQTAAAWGRAHWIGLADVRAGAEGPEVIAWQIHEVAWDESHDAGTHGSHHARIVRFLKEHQVQAIVVDHMGEGMQRVVRNMQIPLLPATPGDAQASIVDAVTTAVG